MRQLALDDAAPEADVGVYEEGLAVDVAKAQRLFARERVRARQERREALGHDGLRDKAGEHERVERDGGIERVLHKSAAQMLLIKDSEATMVPGVVSTTSCVTRQSGAGAQVPILSVRRRVSSEDSSSRMRR